MKKLLSVMVACMMMASLLVTTVSAAPAALLTQTPELGQLKVCKVAGSGVAEGTLFTFKVNGSNYSVPAGPSDRNGYCILAGQYPVNSQATVEEVIPGGYYVSRIEVKPDRTVSKDTAQGKVTVTIVSGVIEVIFTNKAAGSPTPTHTPTSIYTATPRPTKTATSTPSCAPDCTPTSTPVPMGRLQICKEAEGGGVAGSFMFRFGNRSRSVPVGACAGLIAVEAGTLTIMEDPQANYAIADIYTIPADRLLSKDLNSGVANVRIVEGTAISQTIVIFRNRSTVFTPTPTPTSTFTYTPTNTYTPTPTHGTPTPTVTGSHTFTPTPTATYTDTPTPTPTGHTPTPTPTCTPTPITVPADFSILFPGDDLESPGAVLPYLTIDAAGTAVKIDQETDPFLYRATGSGTSIDNGGLKPGGGFSDWITKEKQTEPHEYTFSFDQRITVTEFSLRMLDFGDLNPTLSTNHVVTMTAYNAANEVVDEQVLSFTTSAVRLPPEMTLAGDATGANPQGEADPTQPGNWTWHIQGNGIREVKLTFGEGHDPNIGFDSLSYTMISPCLACTSFHGDLSSVPHLASVEGYGAIEGYSYFSINAVGTAIRVLPGLPPRLYNASGTGEIIINGGISPTGGFGDLDSQRVGKAHTLIFSFAPGFAVREFSLHMLDYGDLNPDLETNHLATMKAYNAAGAQVDLQELSFTTSPVNLPPEMTLAGDATGAVPGQPGNWTWHVAGNGIVKVVLDFPVGHDPNIGFDTLSFSCP